MSTALNVAQWSTTAATNSNIDTGLPVMSNTMDPIGLDDVPRGMMAAIAKWRKDIGGALTAGGTANALTVSTNSAYEAAHLVDGLFIAVRAAADNTSTSVTLNVDSRGALPVKRADGSDLAVGSIQTDAILLAFYDAGAAQWWIANIPPFDGLGLGTAALKNTGTSGNTIPLLDGNNTHSGSLTVSGTFSATGTATLGDGSGDTVVIKGTTVSAYMASLLSSANVGALRTALGLGTGDTPTFAGATFSGTPTAGGYAVVLALAASVDAALDTLGSTKGNILYHNGSQWTVLPPA